MFVPSGYTPEQKQRSYAVAVSAFGPAGNAEQDDAVVWSGTATAGASMYARLSGATLNYAMGLPGMGNISRIPDWPGPGVVYNQRLEDGVQRTILRNWLNRMRTL